MIHMEYFWIAFMALVTFAACFGLDKLFARLFRSRKEHRSGLQVRMRNRVATFGLLIFLLGLACVIFYWNSHPVIFWSGWILLLMGAAMVYYYLSFGLYYDQDGFLYSSFGRKSRRYGYDRIVSQQLYNSQGSTVVELHMADGTIIALQDSMAGWDSFLDYAWERWLEAKGLTVEQCPFHDAGKCCWFPPVEVA